MLALTIFLSLSYALDTPIIGILSQETYDVRHLFPETHYESYIAASYVKFLESAGARVIPVWIGQNISYYQRVVNYTNGIVFPGGATYFNETKGYADAAKIIYHLAEQLNTDGVFYPILGVCLGMQVFAYATLDQDIRISCNLEKAAIPLQLLKGYADSTLLSAASPNLIHILTTQDVTYNYHRFCLTKDSLEKSGMLNEWKILSTNKDRNDLEFISTMESKHFPFYGLQYHPEKNLFEFKKALNIPHSLNAIKVGQYFANLFVKQTRKNSNTFPNEIIAQNSLIYNYNPIFTAPKGSSYEQLYLFTKKDFAKNQLI